MLPSHSAPLGKSNDTSRTCSRLLGHDGSGGEIMCGKPATEHVIYWWSADPTAGELEAGFDHGFCCAEHWADYQRRWKCAGHHEVNGVCGMPGSTIHPSRPCEFDELQASEPVRAMAQEIA